MASCGQAVTGKERGCYHNRAVGESYRDGRLGKGIISSCMPTDRQQHSLPLRASMNSGRLCLQPAMSGKANRMRARHLAKPASLEARRHCAGSSRCCRQCHHKVDGIGSGATPVAGSAVSHAGRFDLLGVFVTHEFGRHPTSLTAISRAARIFIGDSVPHGRWCHH